MGLEDQIKKAGGILETELLKDSREMRLISDVVEVWEDSRAACNVTVLVWLNALLLIDSLYEADVVDTNLTGLQHTNGHVRVDLIEQVWEKMENNVHGNIFKFVNSTFPRNVDRDELQKIFSLLVNVAVSGEDLCVGKMYAKMVDVASRKNSAAFYTRKEAASFLANLTILPSESATDSTEKCRIRSVADFACGTGSLLEAGYKRIRHLARACGIPDEKLHLQMASNSKLCGLDISSVAVHFAATRLIRLQPDIDISSADLLVTKIGRKSGAGGNVRDWQKVSAGSIDLLDNVSVSASLFQSSSFPGSFDVVLMNPPYSGSHGGKPLFDFPWLEKWERDAVRDRVRRLTKNTCSRLIAGLGTTFLAVADSRLKDGGRLGMVLPSTIAGTSDWLPARQLIEGGYSDVTVVFFGNGTGGGKRAVSEDTRIGECMLVATKGFTGRKGIAFVCLYDYFGSCREGIEAAAVVAECLVDKKGGDSGNVGSIGEFRVEDVGSRVWSACGVTSLLNLASKAESIVNGGLLECGFGGQSVWPVKKLGEVFDVGSSHQQIGYDANFVKESGVFAFHEFDGKEMFGKDLALWSPKHLPKGCSVTVSPTHYGVRRANVKESRIEKLRSEKTCLFYCRTVRWKLQGILVAVTETEVLGGRGFLGLSCNIAEAQAMKFGFAVWANSIFGLVSHWYLTGKQLRGASLAGVKDIQNLTIPDFSHPDLLFRSKEAMTEYPDLLSLSLMKCSAANEDATRLKLGEVAARILGIHSDEGQPIIKNLSELWTSEINNS